MSFRQLRTSFLLNSTAAWVQMSQGFSSMTTGPLLPMTDESTTTLSPEEATCKMQSILSLCYWPWEMMCHSHHKLISSWFSCLAVILSSEKDCHIIPTPPPYPTILRHRWSRLNSSLLLWWYKAGRRRCWDRGPSGDMWWWWVGHSVWCILRLAYISKCFCRLPTTGICTLWCVY